MNETALNITRSEEIVCANTHFFNVKQNNKLRASYEEKKKKTDDVCLSIPQSFGNMTGFGRKKKLR